MIGLHTLHFGCPLAHIWLTGASESSRALICGYHTHSLAHSLTHSLTHGRSSGASPLSSCVLRSSSSVTIVTTLLCFVLYWVFVSLFCSDLCLAYSACCVSVHHYCPFASLQVRQLCSRCAAVAKYLLFHIGPPYLLSHLLSLRSYPRMVAVPVDFRPGGWRRLGVALSAGRRVFGERRVVVVCVCVCCVCVFVCCGCGVKCVCL